MPVRRHIGQKKWAHISAGAGDETTGPGAHRGTGRGDTFEHSVDVTIVGILLGKRAGLPRKEVRELALGCLLHDIRKTGISRAILDKAGPLTPQEFEEIKQHPRLGFELIRRMPIFTTLAAHVAYQHHERQHGTGYPRGLVGTNRVFRLSPSLPLSLSLPHKASA